MVLDGAQPSDDSHERHVQCDAELPAQRTAPLPATMQRVQVDSWFNHTDAIRRRDAVTDQVGLHPRAHREQLIRHSRQRALRPPRDPGFRGAEISGQHVSVVDVEHEG